MQREDGVTGKFLEQAIGHHAHRATCALFCRLKNQVQRAIKFKVFGNPFRGGEQGGRVAIVATGVHLAGRGALPIGRTMLGNGQGIHVCPDAQGFGTLATTQAAHHAGAAQAGGDFIAPGRELVRDQAGRAMLFKRQFGVGMQVPANLNEFTHPVRQRLTEISGLHVALHPHWGCKFMALAIER